MNRILRLDKVLSNMGFGSRKEVKQLIKDGAVEIDGRIMRDSSLQVNVDICKIHVLGKELEYKEFVYIMMNKPQGVISATEDLREKTVVDILAPEYKIFGVAPVGRLDKDTEGLLLLTNDGQLAHQLLAPKKHVPKTYIATIEGRVTDTDVKAFMEGVVLDDGYKTLPAELEILDRGSISNIRITIYEGKFHQIKRMFEAVDKRVIYLKRISMGSLKLDDELRLGEYRELTSDELIDLKNCNQ
ncbi:MAG: pseudouridine synthase [Bacillota bacterium]